MEDLPNGPEAPEPDKPKRTWSLPFDLPFQLPSQLPFRLPFGQWWKSLVEAWKRWRASRPKPPVVDEEEIARWITLLSHPNDPEHTRAMDELVVIGRPAIPALIEALRSETWIQVFRASEALGLIGTRRAVRRLLRLLNHPNGNVRWGAAEALGRIRVRWSRGRLHRAANDDESRTSWGETVAEAAERAVAEIDRTWFSRLISVFQVLLLLAACIAIVYFTAGIIQEELGRRASRTPVPTIAPTVNPTRTIVPSPTRTPLPEFAPIAGTITGQEANVRDMPGGDLIGVLHYGDEILIYGGTVDDTGAWWYLIRLTQIHSPATASEVLEAGSYGWLHASLVAGVEDVQVAPTVGAIETMRAGLATPTPIGNALELATPTPPLTATATMTP